MGLNGSIDHFTLSDLPKGTALDECRRAVLEVMMVWPDDLVAPDAMYARASEFFHTDGHDGELARLALGDLIKQCKNYPTIMRSVDFWIIMRGLFERTEVLNLYLRQCKNLTSRKQRRAIVEHLKKNGYSRKEISRAMAKITARKESPVS